MPASRQADPNVPPPRAAPSRERSGDVWPRRVAFVLVCVGLLLSAWQRGPGWAARGFASNDVGGILVNARVLEDGGLPYVETVELKSPGTFYLAAALVDHGPDAIVALTWWANAVALASLASCAALAWRWFGPRAAVACVVLLGLHDAWLDSMDANYVTWANLPTILAGALLVEARALPPGSWHRAAAWFGSGVFAAFAALCKTPAGVVFAAALMIVALDAWAPSGSRSAEGRAGRPGGLPPGLAGALRDGSALSLGAVFGHVPLVLHYASHGALDVLVASYPVSSWVTSYVARRTTSPWLAAREFVFASVYHLALLLLLAGQRLVWWRRSDALAESDDRVIPLLLWASCLLLSAAVGLRFYKGYFVSVAPPLALLASSLWSGRASPLRPVFSTSPGERSTVGLTPALVASVLAALLTIGLGLRQVSLARYARLERAQVMDAGARQIGEWIAAHSTPEDRIWVWGWHLWPVYSYADRRPASAVYKSLGLLTPPNDDTWRTPATPLTFVEGPWSERVLAELQQTAPRFVCLGGTVPRTDFVALRRWLAKDYRRVTELRVGRAEVWERRAP
jgi:hypothetical protein